MSHQRTNGKLAGKSVARLYQIVREIVDRLDPIGLLALGCPADEYAPEIERITQRLATAKALSLEMVQNILHETFVESFDQELAGPKDRYQEAAREIVQHLKTLCH